MVAVYEVHEAAVDGGGFVTVESAGEGGCFLEGEGFVAEDGEGSLRVSVSNLFTLEERREWIPFRHIKNPKRPPSTQRLRSRQPHITILIMKPQILTHRQRLPEIIPTLPILIQLKESRRNKIRANNSRQRLILYKIIALSHRDTFIQEEPPCCFP